MDEKKRIGRAVSSALKADVDVREGREGMWRVAVAGFPRLPRFRTLWLRHGWPADVDAALQRFPAATLLVAPSFSPGAREALNARGVNWVDEVGAANIDAPGLIVRIDRAPAPSEARPKSLAWSPLAVRAAEAVLMLDPPTLSTSWLAEHAECSVPRASGILQTWDTAGWTEKRGPSRGRGAHRVLQAPTELLASWTEHLNAEPVERWFAHSTSRDLHDLEQRLGQAFAGLTFAWTGWAAAEHLAPFISQLPVLHLRISEIHARRELEPALRDAGATMTEDAGRIEIWRAPADAFHHLTTSDDGPVMSWPRVFADLTRLGGRGVDAAEHLHDVMQSNA